MTFLERKTVKCAICGEEFNGYSRNAKYCSKTCAKVVEFNYNNKTNFKTVQEVEEYKKSDSYRGKLDAKPVMQFRTDGSYVRTIPSVGMCKLFGDGTGNFDKNSVSRCARGKRNTYRGYIWIYKEDYNSSILKNRVNKVKRRFDSIKKPVVCLDTDGNYINRFDSVTEGAEGMFVDRISLNDHLQRKRKHKTCVGYVWMYEEDYNRMVI